MTGKRSAYGEFAFGRVLVDAFGFGENKDYVAVLVSSPVWSLYIETDGRVCLREETFCRRTLGDECVDTRFDFVAARLAECDNPERLSGVLLGVLYGGLCNIFYLVRNNLQGIAPCGFLERERELLYTPAVDALVCKLEEGRVGVEVREPELACGDAPAESRRHDVLEEERRVRGSQVHERVKGLFLEGRDMRVADKDGLLALQHERHGLGDRDAVGIEKDN